MDELQIHIVDALRKQRDYYGIPNIEIAKRTDLATNAITKIINGHTNPSAAFFACFTIMVNGPFWCRRRPPPACRCTRGPGLPYIRNYELGNRVPGDEQLTQITNALDVSVEALREIPLESGRQALEFLFRLSEQFSLRPLEMGEKLVLAAPEGTGMDPKLTSALKAWRKQLDSLEAGETTQAEYEEWKASFGS